VGLSGAGRRTPRRVPIVVTIIGPGRRCRAAPSDRRHISEGRRVVKHTATSVVTIERFIIEQERLFPDATGELSGILYDIALAAKMIANKVRSAGLADILGAHGTDNVQGERSRSST
jgi:fructose-1,6-bisphosphatase I